MDENEKATVPTDFDVIVRQALSTQQPFYNVLLNQIDGIERRQGKQANDFMLIRDDVLSLKMEHGPRRMDALEARVKALEDDHQQRRGVVKIAEWAPRITQWLVMVIIVVMLVTKFEVKLP